MNLNGLLHQGEVWIDANGAKHRIADMEPRYCTNVSRFLMRQAGCIAVQMLFGPAYRPMPNPGTTAYDDASAALDVETDRIVSDPVGWVLSTPLLNALINRAEERN